MSLIRCFAACLLVLSLLFRASSSGAAAPAQRSNVLFIMADDLRPDLASYGVPAITPNLDRLARRGVQFQRAYCQQAVCNPSRSSMLTGRRPDSLQLWNNGTHFRERNPEVMTLPLWFKTHGYETRCVGKIFHNWHTAEKGDRRSWSADEFLHYANHGDDVAMLEGNLPSNVASPSPRQYGKVPLYECRNVPDDSYYDGRVASEAVRTLAQVRDKPFFLAVGFWKPHAPFNAPKKYWDLYDRAKLPPLNPARPVGAPDLAFHDGREIRGVPDKQVTFTPEQAAEIRHGYLANISYMDAQVGKVLDALDQHGLSDKTVIVFVGDHGYHVGEHNLWGKTSNFEFDARVPLLISTPGSKQAGQKTTSLVELIDLFPTLIDLCSLPQLDGIEGTSLAPVLKDPSVVLKAGAFTQHPRPAYYDREPSKSPTAMGCSVRTNRVRYTEWRDWKSGDTVARELYDHQRDPLELTNAVDEASLAGAQREAEDLLRKQFPKVAHSVIGEVTSPPADLKVAPFYKKYIDASGYPIVASANVNDYALREAAYLVNLLLAKRPDVRAAMVKSGSRLCIIAHNEFTTDMPEWEKMTPKDFWDARARGTGGSATDPYCSCGEENLLCYQGDPYSTENILIHEFAHNIHLRGMVNVDESFDTRVKAAYDDAMAAGLWKGKYASVNHHEYFAEGVQSWFDNNRENDHDHNHVNTRVELLEYDPKLAAVCREVFGDTELKYTKPTTRLRDHLAGYDPSKAPTFVWPERLTKTRDEIRQKAQARNKAPESEKSKPGDDESKK